MSQLAENSKGKWPGILEALGVDSKFLSNKHGPCPFCGGQDRFRFDDKNGSGSFFCSQCGAGSGIDFVIRTFGSNFKEAAERIERVLGTVRQARQTNERSEADKVAVIRRVLQECRTVTEGDPVWKYLNRRTGVELIPTDIRFHPALLHTDGGKHPTMISIIRSTDGSGASLHRTYLTTDGFKADVSTVKKIMPGKAIKGAAVRLSVADGYLGIAEGIETALCASGAFCVPVWAATNSVLLEQFIPPDGVKRVHIFGDNDSSFTGQAAAYSLARRLVRDGYEVKVSFPDQVDTDFCHES